MENSFEIAPYSVIDTRLSYWQKRKKDWRELIGRSFASREGKLCERLEMRLPRLYASSKAYREANGITFKEYVEQLDLEGKNVTSAMWCGVSEFDPALAEIIYKWYTPKSNSNIFDPFAGGPTKGLVASLTGHQFYGIELREEQVEINREKAICLNARAKYVQDDAKNVTSHFGVATMDLLFTCPPYYNLEVYSNLKEDLSSKPTYNEYLKTLNDVLCNSLKCLKANRFAVIVISDIRSQSGAYYGLPEDVITLMKKQGCHLWNDIVIVNGVNAIPMKQLHKTRKTLRCHQRALIFYKGNPAHITKHFNNL